MFMFVDEAHHGKIFQPILTYHWPTISLTTALERRLVTWEMRCTIRATNETRRDTIRKEILRDRVGRSKISPNSQKAAKDQLVWTCHTDASSQQTLHACNSKTSVWRAMVLKVKETLDGFQTRQLQSQQSDHHPIAMKPVLTPTEGYISLWHPSPRQAEGKTQLN